MHKETLINKLDEEKVNVGVGLATTGRAVKRCRGRRHFVRVNGA